MMKNPAPARFAIKIRQNPVLAGFEKSKSGTTLLRTSIGGVSLSAGQSGSIWEHFHRNRIMLVACHGSPVEQLWSCILNTYKSNVTMSESSRFLKPMFDVHHFAVSSRLAETYLMTCRNTQIPQWRTLQKLWFQDYRVDFLSQTI